MRHCTDMELPAFTDIHINMLKMCTLTDDAYTHAVLQCDTTILTA
jgi:hypothetical protein